MGLGHTTWLQSLMVILCSCFFLGDMVTGVSCVILFCDRTECFFFRNISGEDIAKVPVWSFLEKCKTYAYPHRLEYTPTSSSAGLK